MIIQMRFQISGGRYDDRPWPGPGIAFEVPDWEGQGLVKDGAAVFVSNTAARAPVKKAPEPAPVPEVPSTTVTAPASATAVTELPAPTAAVTEPVPAPAPAEPKAAWVEYAISRGAGRADAESMTKAQLQAAYGGRL